MSPIKGPMSIKTDCAINPSERRNFDETEVIDRLMEPCHLLLEGVSPKYKILIVFRIIPLLS
jgi:hypothetical protein